MLTIDGCVLYIWITPNENIQQTAYINPPKRLKLLIYCNVLGYARDLQTGFGLDIGFIDRLHTPLRIIRRYSAIAYLHTLQFDDAHALGFSVFIRHVLTTDL
jgi:hypothetical protein